MKYSFTATDNTAFIALFDSLSRKLAYDIENTTAKQSIRILHNWLFDRGEPVVLIESLYSGSTTYACYYPLSAESYCNALLRSSLVRFNMHNMFSNRKRVFTGGVDRRDGVCYLYVNLDLPTPPNEGGDTMNSLHSFMEAFARSLCVGSNQELEEGACCK